MLLQVRRIEPGDKLVENVPGKTVTLELPDAPIALTIWSEIIAWLQANPEIIMLILTALASLFSIMPEARKALEKVGPPTK